MMTRNQRKVSCSIYKCNTINSSNSTVNQTGTFTLTSKEGTCVEKKEVDEAK